MGYWPALRGTLADAAASVSKTADRIFRGDVRSANWDGGGDLSGGRDTTATQGYLIDYSSGSAQFVNIYADGGELRTLTITDVLTMDSGTIRSASSGKRIEIFSPTADNVIKLFSGNSSELEEGSIQVLESDVGGSELIEVHLRSPRGGPNASDYGQGILQLGPNRASSFGGAELSGIGTGTYDGDVYVLGQASGSGDATVRIEAKALGAGTETISLSADGGITVNGSLMAAGDWTPTYANLTIGNGTVTARWQQVGDFVTCWFDFVLGSTSAVGTQPTISTPVTASSSYTAAHNAIGPLTLRDSGSPHYNGYVRLESTTTIAPLVFNSSATYLSESVITATVPITWTTGDRIVFTATFEAA